MDFTHILEKLKGDYVILGLIDLEDIGGVIRIVNFDTVEIEMENTRRNILNIMEKNEKLESLV